MRVLLLAFVLVSARAADRADIEFARPGGAPLLLDLHVPDGAGPFPAAILVHGGGFDEGSRKTNVRPLFEPLAKAGFAWFSIDYRLAPTAKFPEAIGDVNAAIRWVKAHAAEYHLDPTKLSLIGESAGGLLVNYAGTHDTPETKVAAVVDFYGPADYGKIAIERRDHPERFNMTSINRHFANGGGIRFFGVESLDAAGLARLRELAPITGVHRGMPPFLAIHGTKDDQVPYDQSTAFCEAIRKTGTGCELITIEGGGHGMSGWRAPEMQHWKAEMIGWLQKTLHTGGTAAAPAATPLWANGPPGDTRLAADEADTTKDSDNKVAGRRVERIGNVSTPTMTVYRPPKEKDTGTAVVVFPGGGYNILATDLEGTEICEWLNSIGVTGVMVKYRVPARPGRPRYAAPLEDAQRAVGLVRSQAASLGIDPKRIGVLGFSAGGHLAAALSNNFDHRAYTAVDGSDQIACRPDFAILIYPAYLTVREEGDKIAPELKITKETPPTFLVQTEDDGVRVENSLFYYAALKNARVPAEMHIYPSGGHGYGLRRTDKAVTTWPARAEEWLAGLGMLKR